MINEKEIKIVHVHSASNASFVRKAAVSIAAKLLGKKTVFHIHSGGFRKFYERSTLKKFFIRSVLRANDSVICLSKEWSDFFIHDMGLRNVHVIGNPVELNKEADEHKHTGKLKLLFLGKICDDKGIFGLVEYLKTNKHFTAGKIQLIIGGSGENKRLTNALCDPVVHDRILFAGWVEGTMKNKLLKECDIFILPSLMEGLPVSVLEAMGNSKPIISTIVGGIPSLIKENFNGWLIRPGQFDELDHVFDNIFYDQDLLDTYGKNSMTEASKYSSDVIMEQLAFLYQSLLVTPIPAHA